MIPPILMKFGTVMHISPLKWTKCENFEFLKSKMAATAIFKSQKLRYLTSGLTKLHKI